MSDELQCPKCEGDLEIREAGENLKVRRCNRCYGLFVPAGITHKLLAAWSPESDVDTGSESLGKKYDKVDDIQCPVCKVTMDKIEDPNQPHIWLENCSVCGATFFDAGEFTDLREKTLSDIFKSLFKGKRQ